MRVTTQSPEYNLSEYATLLTDTPSLERMDVLKSIPEYFSNRVKGMSDFIHGLVDSMDKIDTRKAAVPYRNLAVTRLKLKKNIGKIDYAMVKRRKTPIIIGMDVDVLKLATLLKEGNEIIVNNIYELLNETSETIARLVSDQEYRVSNSPIKLSSKYIKAYKRLDAILNEALNDKNLADSVAVKDIAPSVMHIVKATDIALDYSKTTTLEQYEDISKLVDTVSNYTDTLYEALTSSDVNVKKVRVEEIANYLDATANFVTRAVSIMHLSTQSAGMLDNLIQTVISKK